MPLSLVRSVPAVPSPAAHCGRSASAALVALSRFPVISAQLHERGVSLVGTEGESQEAFENRLTTQLMALYRDTRSERSFEALYAVSETSVLQWIRRLLARGNAHLDPVEMLQDTFVNVFRYPKSFRDDHIGSYRVWVRTIAGNIVRRARGRTLAHPVQALPEGAGELADSCATPESNAQVGEQVRGLQGAWVIFLLHYSQAWKELRPRDQQALVLVEVEGRTYIEAGEILSVGRSNMKMIIFRARKRIAAAMQKAMRGTPLVTPLCELAG